MLCLVLVLILDLKLYNSWNKNKRRESQRVMKIRCENFKAMDKEYKKSYKTKHGARDYYQSNGQNKKYGKKES